MLLAALSMAQPEARPKFDVTSVKPHAAGTRMGGPMHAGSLTMGGITVFEAMQQEYHVRAFQIDGGPSWVRADRWDLQGSAPGDANLLPGTAAQKRMMEQLQGLLEERFQLKLRQESSVMPLFRLTVARSGLKLKEGEALANPKGGTSHRIERQRATMADLAWALTGVVGAMVEDQTGLTGLYSYSVEWRDDPEFGVGATPGSGTGCVA